MNPNIRLQRLRQTPALRAIVAETHLSADDFIAPLFVSESLNEKKAIAALPGVYQFSLSDILTEVKSLIAVGIKAVILFGIPEKKDSLAYEAHAKTGIVQQTIRLIKSTYPDLIIIADCCLCEYTDHGHCGIVKGATSKGHFDHKATLSTLQAIAISYAEAGVDIVAPSGMMDGMIASLRTALDANGFDDVSLLSYAVKYASSLYGPFREAAGSSQFTGDRNHHQLNPSQFKEALREAECDVAEGADMLMVKPGLFYTDIIRSLADRYNLPLAAYQVSGEYAMFKNAAAAGIISERAVFEESFISLKRAGASLIISYYAKDYLTS